MEKAKTALVAIWQRRSSKNLIGNGIDAITGEWLTPISGIGAGIDSFFEYLIKAYIAFDDDDFLNMFQSAYSAIMKHSRDENGMFYRNVHMGSLALSNFWIDSLSAFWPGLQVMFGDIESAKRAHLPYYLLWQRYGGVPERFDLSKHAADIDRYPLRPELIESTYFLYQATGNEYYLKAGAQFVQDFERFYKTRCGFATMGSLRTKKPEDRMESFFLSETLKYLYLLFDPNNRFHALYEHVYTTGNVTKLICRGTSHADPARKTYRLQE